VLDVGANLGAYALLFGFWTRPGGHVFAFEPAPVPCAGLISHVALNGLRDRVTVVPQAVTAGEGTVEFLADGIDGGNRVTAAADGEAAKPGRIQVTTTSIDAFCRLRNIVPQFIKIDAEGAELDVLRGARDTIRRASGALRLYVEMHPHLWSAFDTSRAEIEAELATQGLVAERIDGDADVWGLEGVCLRLKRA